MLSLPAPDETPDAEAGHPFVTAFAQTDYGAGQLNFAVVADTHGVLYVGNDAGLLEYDGARWRLVPTPGRTAVRSLARDATGRVWAGGLGTFGYLAPDSVGRTQFVSLREAIPAAQRAFREVWGAHATSHGIYFLSSEALFRWDGRRVQAWPMRHWDRSTASFLVRDELYVWSRGRGLQRLEQSRSESPLRPVPGGERFAETQVSALVPLDAGRVLVVTATAGLFVYDGTRITPLAADERVERAQLTEGVALTGGRIALGTRRDGLLVIDREGRVLHHLDRSHGLPHNAVLALHAAEAGGLWVGLGGGLAHIELDSPFTRYGPESGIPSIIYGAERHRGRFYVLMPTTGIASLDPEQRAFQLIAGSPTSGHNLHSVGPDLFLTQASDGRLHRVEGGRSSPVVEATTGTPVQSGAVFEWSRAPGTLFVGWPTMEDAGEVSVLRRTDEGKWARIGRLPQEVSYFRWAAEDGDGAVWLSARPGHVARVRLPTPDSAGAFAPEAAEVTWYGVEDGVPESAVYPYAVRGEVVLTGSDERLARFDAAAGRFVPDPRFDAAKSGHPLGWLSLHEDVRGRVWIASTYGPPAVAHPRPGGRYAVEVLHRFRHSRIRDTYPEPDGVVWFRGENQLVRFDTDHPAATASAPPPLVREVSVGAERAPHGSGHTARPTEVAQGAGAVRFAYAAPGPGAPRYRTRLAGFDDGWSPWSGATERTYTNLPAGTYRFEVEAEGRPGRATYALRVTPPWFRTPWAYAVAALLAAALGYAALRLHSRHLYRRQRVLDLRVAERTRALWDEQRKTKAQAERLREMDRLKSRFFTNVAHEFRTPLTLIIGPLEDLQRSLSAAATPEDRQRVGLALRNGRRLLRLINQLLDIAKLEAGELRLRPARQDLAAFVRETARAFVPLAERQRVRFTMDIPPTPLPATYDADKVEQVLVNLLSNAFKFTPQGGAISVHVRRAAGGVEVAVRDSGPGIAPEAIPHLFERFYQADETRSDLQPGTGIGLSLAKDLAELHGGSISVESALGAGSTFTLRLPLPGAPPPAVPDGDDRGARGDGRPGPQRPALCVPPANTPEDDGPAADRTVVLVADDNADIRAYVRSHLEPLYRVLEAPDGAEALNVARAELPDLILSDVMMPRLDGLELIRALRADRETDFIPVVLLTAKATEDDRVEGLNEGADAYLTKPFRVRELLACIDGLIRARQRLQSRFASASGPAAAPASPLSPPLSPSEAAYLRDVRAAVVAELDNPDLSVEEIAAAVGQSRTTLYRRLRDLVGQTPSEYIRNVRLAHAAALLRQRHGTVSEVAYAVGFRSVSHFCQTFREAHGTTPSSFVDAASVSED